MRRLQSGNVEWNRNGSETKTDMPKESAIVEKRTLPGSAEEQ
jgi:hypothetical protein